MHRGQRNFSFPTAKKGTVGNGQGIGRSPPSKAGLCPSGRLLAHMTPIHFRKGPAKLVLSASPYSQMRKQMF